MIIIIIIIISEGYFSKCVGVVCVQLDKRRVKETVRDCWLSDSIGFWLDLCIFQILLDIGCVAAGNQGYANFASPSSSSFASLDVVFGLFLKFISIPRLPCYSVELGLIPFQ